MGKGVLLASVCAVCALIAAPSASAQSPSTLDGELLVSLFSKCNGDPGGTAPPYAGCTPERRPETVEATCDEDGVSVLRYDITESGPQNQGSVPITPDAATGPYTGSFTESGTVRIDPQVDAPVPTDPSGPFGGILTGSNGFATGPLLSWDAEFEIQAANGTVRGTKTLTTRVPPAFGVCDRLNGEVPNPPITQLPVTGYGSIADARLAYAATIQTADGNFRDEGFAESDLREVFALYGPNLDNVAADVGFLVEMFDSTQSEPTPVSKEDCKDGGWATLGLGFKNQGDCVSYFATDGRNGPAG